MSLKLWKPYFSFRASACPQPLRGQHLLTAETEPGVRAVALVQILHLPCRHLVLVGDIEHIAQHLHFFALLSLAQKGTHRYAEELAHQVEHGALDGPLALDHELQLGDIQRLDALAVVSVGMFCNAVDLLQHLAVAGYRLAFHQRADRIQAVAGIVAAVDLAHAGVAGIVGQHHQIAGKAGRMCARKSHQHSIVTRNGDDLHFRNDR